MLQNNEVNRQRLSEAMVDGWDLNDLVSYAIQSLAQDMAEWEDSEFRQEWESVFDEIQPEEGPGEE